jgi:hypothetical protein
MAPSGSISLEPILGLCRHRGFAVSQNGQQADRFVLLVQCLFQERGPFEIQKCSGFGVRLLGRPRLEQLAQTCDVVRLPKRPLEVLADRRAVRFSLVDLPEQSCCLDGQSESIQQDLGALQIQIARLGRRGVEFPSPL